MWAEAFGKKRPTKRPGVSQAEGSLETSSFYEDAVGSLTKHRGSRKICFNRHLNKACSFLSLLKLITYYLGWTMEKFIGPESVGVWAARWADWGPGRFDPERKEVGVSAPVSGSSGLGVQATFLPGRTGFCLVLHVAFFFFFLNSNLNWRGCCLQLRF